MNRNEEREKAAKQAVMYILTKHPSIQTAMQTSAVSPIGLILGTGWGDVLKISDAVEIPFQEIPGFEALGSLAGHARRLAIGRIGEKNVLVLRGRVHLNEAPNDPNITKMVRLQTDILFHLGARTLIVTSAVGGLRGRVKVGQVAVVDGFITLHAPEMPLWAGEFSSPESTLCPQLRQIAHEEHGALVTEEVGHVMVRGPGFEGLKYDKGLLAKDGAGVVGMSMLPEAYVAGLYREEGAETLGLGFVTNDDVAEHSHEANQACAARSAVHLGEFLTRIIGRV